MNGGNRSTNRFSALQSLAAEQDTEIEDELARGELCKDRLCGVQGRTRSVVGGSVRREEVYAWRDSKAGGTRHQAVVTSCTAGGLVLKAPSRLQEPSLTWAPPLTSSKAPTRPQSPHLSSVQEELCARAGRSLPRQSNRSPYPKRACAGEAAGGSPGGLVLERGANASSSPSPLAHGVGRARRGTGASGGYRRRTGLEPRRSQDAGSSSSDSSRGSSS